MEENEMPRDILSEITHKKMLLQLQDKFFEKLENGTFWGRVEIKELFQVALVETCTETLEYLIKKQEK